MTTTSPSDPLIQLRRAVERVESVEADMARLASELAVAKSALLEAERALASSGPQAAPAIPQPSGLPSTASDGAAPSAFDAARASSGGPLPVIPQPSGFPSAEKAPPKLGIFRSLARSLAAFAQPDASAQTPAGAPPKAPPPPPLAPEAKALVSEVREGVKAAQAFFFEAAQAAERGHSLVERGDAKRGVDRLNEAGRAAARLLSRADALGFDEHSRRRVFGLKTGLQMASNSNVLPHGTLGADMASCRLGALDELFSDRSFRSGLCDVLGASVVDRPGGPLNLYMAALQESVSRYSNFLDDGSTRANCARLADIAPEPLDPKVAGTLAARLDQDTWDLLAPLLRAGSAEAEREAILDASAPASASRPNRGAL